LHGLFGAVSKRREIERSIERSLARPRASSADPVHSFSEMAVRFSMLLHEA
jgi:hypothetical protein